MIGKESTCPVCLGVFKKTSNVQRFCTTKCRYEDEKIRYSKEYKALQSRRYRARNLEKCRKQWLKDRLKYRDRRLEYSRANAHKRTKEQMKAVATSYYSKNKHKVYARKLVLKAIKSGELIRPNICSRCNSVARVQAHHEDYSKPLEVMWLCVTCHRNLHGEKYLENMRLKIQAVSDLEEQKRKLLESNK